MKSRILKAAMVATCALAFMNCGDDVANNVNGIPDNGQGSLENPIDQGDPNLDPSNPITDPNTPADPSNPVVDPNTPADPSNPTVDPTTPADPTSSASVEPVSSATVDPTSSVAAAPAPTSSAEAPVVSSSSEAPKGIFLAEGTDETKRHLEIEYKEGQGPDNQSVLAYPKQLSTTQKHGVVVWGPGGGEKPGNYPDMIKDLAAQGFVVIGIRESPGDGSLAINAINWLEKENVNPASIFNGKLELTRVGCSGHSMGGLESEEAAIKDERVVTAFLNNSGERSGQGAFKYIPATKTAGVVFGEKGIEHDNAIADYNSATTVPACMIEMVNGPRGGEGGWGHGSGPWDGRAITVAWMRWQLGGEDFRKADFVGTSGKYINGNIEGHQGQWKGQCKNF